MAGKRTYRARGIPSQGRTGAEEHAAVAAKGDRYVADIGGERGADGLYLAHTTHWVIRDSDSGDIVEHCKSGMTEAHERAAQWNRGLTRGENISWGKLQRTIPEGSAPWWAERLCGDPQTGPELQRLVGTVLRQDNLKQLLARTTQHGPHLAMLDDARLLDAISQHLFRYFGILRADDHR